ncbi:MAG: peptidylprolyl isomerase [Pseudomonadales bacterium]|uniref:Peptidyl-prolyl cis-trans isomerase n=1 Tax=Oleiphilus messinensis TaxID=141451 RepID=A0A1Y0I2M4_9GAMM|nr:peptidylprolyl isomerase [Oleiphilus messinensis]ARU54722.1 FKBP-type peptidylprolyl isomerase [Oleiphilus messinensis]MCG8611254.1 peptidylprolyl isomerase [Pseudomonadales bacterium]
MSIANGKVVQIHYTLTDNDGNVVDSSQGAEPLTYLHGASNIIPGLENALTGKNEGDELNVTIAPEDGYGPHVPELVQEVPREAFQGVEQIQAGMTFQAADASGNTQNVVVTAVSDEAVTVDGNHPLAGQDLNFAVSVVTIRQAEEEEIAHGHVHN